MTKKEDFSLENALDRLREIVGEMQDSEVNFDTNINLFREGSELIKNSREYLDNAELLIQKLIEKDSEETEE